jgi:DNA polymerase I-like protein with 3'-5' exonuclease and polymerase domains
VGKLLRILGVDVEDTSESTLEAVAYKNPLAGYWTSQILEVRGLTKLLGTYFKEEKLFHGRFMFSLLPYGTDTGRNASGEHAFWCGQNLQNIPRGEDVKQYMVADDGFVMFECDSEQAETRDTAYISGDTNLINAVEGGKDFHSLNCSAFFGVPYEDIFNAATGKVLLKPLRDLAKRVNHGANYCMGPAVLITTMGLKNVEYARKALQLERGWSYKQIAEYLLSRFHATYPDIERKYYRYVRQAVSTTKLLTGATGWTRYCFGDINQKRTFNSYVAHNPQSLNAMRLDEAFLAVFNQLAMHPEHSKNFVLYCQIHDSIFGQVRKGHTHLIDKVKQLMEIPITIKGCDGITRTYTVPAAAKAGKNGQGAPRWSETE